MRGSVWTLCAAGIGAGVMLMAAVPAAVPNSAAGSTDAVGGVLSQIAPFAGLAVTVGAIFALLSLVFKL